MNKITVRGVLQSEPSGGKGWAGFVPLEQEVEGLMTSPVEVLDLEDESDTVWVLAKSDAIPLLDLEGLAAIRSGEVARTAKAKLTDEELVALGLTRD